MRLIKPSFEILEQKPGLDGLLQHIERCGRTCYKSEDKITEESAPKFVDMLVKRGHTAMVEHGTVYLKYSITLEGSMNMANKYHFNKYSTVTIGNEPLCGGEPQEYKDKFDGHTCAYITTNYRVLLQNDWLDDLRYLCAPTEYHEKRVTVHFTLDRAISMEFLRHRKMSFTQESTRYCNYSNKDKFGGEVTFIIPCWMDTIEEGAVYSYDTDIELWQKSEDANTSNFLQSIAWAEKNYLTLLHNSWTPQQARAVLPNALKTELVMTGFISDWKHFFELRDSNKAHPQARELASPLHKEFIEKGLIK